MRLLNDSAIIKPLPAKRAEKLTEEIRALKQQMEFILGATKTGLDIIDSEFNIRYIDPEWAKVYGDPTGKKCFEYFMGRSEVCPHCGIPTALKTKTTTVTEEILINEGNRPIRVTTIPFQNEKGEWLVAEVNVDISERKHAEQVLRKTQEDQEMSIQERTAHLVRKNEAMELEISESKRVEDALRESEKRFRELYDNAPVGYHEYDREGRITKVNQTGLEMLGYAAEELIGRPIWEINVGEEVVREQVLAKLAGTSPPGRNLERSYRRKNGTTFPVLIENRLILDERGQIKGIRSTVQDITWIKMTEEALRRSEEKERQLAQENAIVAEIGRIISSTPKIEEVYERFAEEVRKLISFDRIAIRTIDPKDNTATIAYISGVDVESRRFGGTSPLVGSVAEECMRTQSSILFEPSNAEEVANRFPTLSPTFEAGLRSMMFVPLISKDQVIGILSLQATQANAYTERDLKLAEKVGYQIAGAIANAQLFTEQRRTEEALRASERRYRTLAEAAQDMIFIIDSNDQVQYVNGFGARQIGYRPEQIIGKPRKDFFPLVVSDKQKNSLQKVFETGKALYVENKLFSSSREMWLSTWLVPVTNDSGETTAVLGISRDVTERKIAEEALRESEEKFRDLYDNAPIGYHEYDKDGRITKVNQTDLEMLGYTAEELIGRPIWELNVGAEIVREQVLTKLAGTSPPGRNLERTYQRKDGTTFPVLIQDRLILDEMGQIKGIRCTIQDITEIKQAEEALQKSEERAKRIAQENVVMAEIGRIISSTLNIDDVYERFAEKVRSLIPSDRISINIINPGKATATMTYVTGVEVADRRCGDIVSIEGNTITQECMRTRSSLLFQPGSMDEGIYRFPTLLSVFGAGLRSIMLVPLISKDELIGVLHLVSTKPKAYSESDVRLAERIGNQIAGAIANAQLFAERKRAEEALRKSEEKFQKLFDEAPVGYMELDAKGCISQVNRTELTMLGYTSDEMLGQPLWKFVVEEEAAREKIKAKLSGSSPFDKGFERTYKRKDGTTLPVMIEDALIRDADGTIIGIHATIRDVSEHKRVEKEMADLQEQLRQSQKIEAIGQLAGGVAHDFNNLLTVIKGYTQLSLLDLKENSPLWGNIQEIQKATQRATDLTRQLLAFSRRQILDPKVLDLNSLLRDTEKMLRRMIGEDIELITLLSEDLGRVKIDPGQIEQVVLNLAVNARDAMPSGGKLTIETANVESDEDYAHAHIGVLPGRYVRLSVSDTGIGMSREVQEKAFDPFFTTKDKGKGTGLGLSTVYGIVTQSGGKIWVYSEPGHGTTFKIYFPRIEGELDALTGKSETDSFPGGSETVLLVEDEPSVRDLANRLLRQQGYRVLEAANGKDALRLVQENGEEKIHLLLTDVVLPQMGGKELADQLKTFLPDLKVLYTSGYTDYAIVHHGVLDSGTHFLQKPFSLKTLSTKVREVLDG